jgi:hypothetical protein
MKLKRIVALLWAVGCSMQVQPGVHVGASAASGAQTPGDQQPAVTSSGLRICGITMLRDGTTVADVRVRLRNVDKNTVVGQTVSDKNGAFAFAVPAPGLHVVEAVNKDGSVIAVGPSLNLTTDPLCGDVILPSRNRGLGAFFSSAAFPILAAAGGAGITAWAISGAPSVSPER